MLSQAAAEDFLAKLDSRPACNSGHPLFMFGSPVSGWWCSSREKVFSSRKLPWGCRVCDYDICGRCLATLRHRTIAAEAEPPMSTASSDPYNQVVTAADFSICLSSAAGALSQSECFPDTLGTFFMHGRASKACTCNLFTR